MYDKLNVSLTDKQAISSLISQGGAGVVALKKVLESYLAELKDINNIDPKGNMGLQALANQNAYKNLSEFFKEIFEGQSVEVKDGNKMSPWR